MDPEKTVAGVGIVLIIIFAAIGAGIFVFPQEAKVYVDTDHPGVPVPILMGVNATTIRVPAVDENGTGVISTIDVQVVPGKGRTLTNIDSVLFWVDTQDSIRTARAVAENFTGVNLSEYDVIYTINAGSASIVEGGSAGGALAVATIAEIQGKKLREDVMMTGTINSTGFIGGVGGVPEKFEAAKEMGISFFIVPEESDVSPRRFERRVKCSVYNSKELCEVEYIPLMDDNSIEVIEVSNIKEAVEIFLEGENG